MSTEALFSALASRPANEPVLNGDSQTWHAANLRHAVEELSSRLAGSASLAVLADNSPDWVVADLAALHAGIAHIPLPVFFSPAQLAHILEQTGCDAVLTDQPERIAALDAGFSVDGKWSNMVLLRRRAVPARLPAGTAKVSFTSGSTGTPKGACLSTDGLLDTAHAVASRLADLPIERHLAVLPLSLLLENTAGIYAPLLRGSTIDLPGLQILGWQGMSGFDPAALQRSVNALRPNSLILVPELLKAWSMYLTASIQRANEELAYVAVGGARVDAGLLQRARAHGLPAYQGYGLTECGSVVSINRPGDDADDVGRPLDHVSLRIEDGEIIASTRAFLGYLGAQEALGGEPCRNIDAPRTAEAGQPSDAGNSRARQEFATGDLGHLDSSGHLHLSGRRKSLLITSFGRNIAPEWIESVLLAQPEISQTIVTGDARPWLAALLVPAPGTSAERLNSVIVRVNETLPDYARIGGWIAVSPFTPQNGLATSNGRPVRAAIMNQHASTLAALYPENSPAKEPDHVVL